MSQLLGKLERLRRYPVKSMGGEDCSALFVQASPHGLVGDRLFGLRKKGSNLPGVSKNYVSVRTI